VAKQERFAHSQALQVFGPDIRRFEMNEFLQRLKQRKLVQWALAYVAAAFALLQGIDIVAQRFEWPGETVRLVIIALSVGLFVTLVLAWYHGERGAQKVSGTELLIIGLVLAMGGGLLWRFATAYPQKQRISSNTDISAKSIAVLPFVNMTADKQNEFFADGLSEEILNSLARIDGMRVIGRTSSFQFKGKAEDLRTIGETLGAANVLEGSVRREGDRARITAQLIHTSDGIHLWSETYDRTLTDTLAVQLDIAEHVAGALDVVLDDKQRAEMRAAGVKDVDAFIAYQKGLKLYADAHNPEKSRDVIEGLRLANKEFDRAIALEPGFSQSYFQAADLYDHILLADDRPQAERLDAQRQALNYYGQAAANSHDEQQRLLTLADRQLVSDDWRGLKSTVEAALRAPGCNAPDWLPVFASIFGYGDLIEDLGKRVSVYDPLNSINYNSRTRSALVSAKPELALKIQNAAEKAKGGPPVATGFRAEAFVMLNRIDEAKAELSKLARTDELYYRSVYFAGLAAGESAASIHARLQTVNRSQSIYKLWGMTAVIEAALSGNRTEANRLAAKIDAQPGGGLVLAVITADYLSGAPFDLEATPNFKARLAESGLPWPPAPAFKFAPRAVRSP
jgi:TolB-like protein